MWASPTSNIKKIARKCINSGKYNLHPYVCMYVCVHGFHCTDLHKLRGAKRHLVRDLQYRNSPKMCQETWNVQAPIHLRHELKCSCHKVDITDIPACLTNFSKQKIYKKIS